MPKSIGELMSRDPITCPPDAAIRAAAELMRGPRHW